MYSSSHLTAFASPLKKLCSCFLSPIGHIYSVSKAPSKQAVYEHESIGPYLTSVKRCRFPLVSVRKISSPSIATTNNETFHQLYSNKIPSWLLNRLETLSFTTPTPIQRAVLQVALPDSPEISGKDVVIHAQTGSGKTLAYLLPVITAVAPERSCVQALVIVPTQELGMQVYKLLRRLTVAYAGDNISAKSDRCLSGNILATDASETIEFEDKDIGKDNRTFIPNDMISNLNDKINSTDNMDHTENIDVKGGGELDTHDGVEMTSFPVLPMLNQANLRRQKLQLREAAPRVLVGNPRRIAELVETGRLRLDLLKVLVVDEFDACLGDTSTTAALQTILGVRNRERTRQTILASATVPQHRHFLRQCVRQRWTTADIRHIWLDKASGVRVPPSLTHAYALCDGRKKIAALRTLITRFNEDVLAATQHTNTADERAGHNGPRLVIRAMVFIMQSRDVDGIVDALNSTLVNIFKYDGDRLAEGVHNDLCVARRKEAVQRFRSGDARILVGTDIAARGLDFADVSHVFHFDLPTDADGYLHRAGRSGRQGRPGISVVLLTRGEEFVVRRISNTLDIEFERVGR